MCQISTETNKIHSIRTVQKNMDRFDNFSLLSANSQNMTKFYENLYVRAGFAVVTKFLQIYPKQLSQIKKK